MGFFWGLAAVLAAVLSAAAEAAEIPPLIRGTLWWVGVGQTAPWTEGRLRAAIEAQWDVGFDLLWILNTPELYRRAVTPAESGPREDLLAVIYAIADEKNMRVLSDLPQGGWHGKTTAEEMAAEVARFAGQYHGRYGAHRSFWGWYLNHEINPIAPEDTEQTTYWRTAWTRIVEACHGTHPGAQVAISPFFLLDAAGRRGFVYLSPEQYAGWWEKTLRITGIDILMLQDSGEHLSFFGLAEREPYWAAVAKACRAAGSEFWVNVESGHAEAADWEEYLRLERDRQVPWAFTPMTGLEEKLRLAARYGSGIVNWGYFPYMDPHSGDAKAREAYAAYKAYVQGVLAK